MAKSAAAKTESSARKTLTCDVCGQKFAMPAHLGRHMTAMHGKPSKTGGKKKKRKVRKTAKAAKKTATKKVRRGGRPPAIVSRFKLNELTLDELATLIKAARNEAQRRLEDFQDMLAK